LLYAGCVVWPFHFSPTVGYAVGGAVLVFGTLDNVVKLIRGPRKKALAA
jgi:hypothetical protein